MSSELQLKPLPHCRHLWGFSPVWVRMWAMRWEFWLKLFPHSEQAGVGLLARVAPLVDDEAGALVVALLAQQALVGLLARVRALVQLQVGALAEALVAVGALEGLLARVGASVRVQGGPLPETLAALVALVGLLHRGRRRLLLPTELDARAQAGPKALGDLLALLLEEALLDGEVAEVEVTPSKRDRDRPLALQRAAAGRPRMALEDACLAFSLGETDLISPPHHP
ncbi:Acetate kinase, partial [Varanus komodoensis]